MMIKAFSLIRRLLVEAASVNAFLVSTTLAVNFPIPSGPFNTTLVISQLTDHSRLDLYSPIPVHRSIMISIFHPATCLSLPTSYMDATTAAWTDSQLAPYGIPAGAFELLYLQTCPHGSHPPDQSSQSRHKEMRASERHKKQYPLLLFSPGLGDPRLYYSALAQQVASQGFTVMTIDHPYDAGIVVYPDNSTISGADIETDEQILFDLSVRVKDISFVLDQLSHPSLTCSLIPGLELDTKKVGIFGHSLGGAAAAQAMLEDDRLVGGINLDGTFFGSVVESGLSSPFLIFAHEGKNISTDASWSAVWPKLTGFKRVLELTGSAHGTFLDFPAVVDVLGLKGQLPSEVEELLGSINGLRALKILGTYIGAFFDQVVKGKKTDLLDGPSGKFPEIVFEEVDHQEILS
ncbi:putative 1-alkyl-2-acetylglycerophosphocholine esterase [Hyphodiscus hymeniophilus]|uniref:1-alkyl-2-acetylglycerophosphocholine esterase n=1 Tax=Hyphodiscus hymeniophilus TaxID=353542 RepID=A0A9P6VGP2_9HELO|nr:putative 1-alkyl-2-acetylglycerophosphocholine esterase [Hyphodiscus hymeniophilus]